MPNFSRISWLARIWISARFAADPFAPHSWATALRGSNDRFRIRQGDWRGVMLILRERDAIILERVAHRREVYR